MFFDLNPLPVPLGTPFGTLQLNLGRAITTHFLPLTGTPFHLDLILPNVASAAGPTLYSQGAVLRPSAGIVLTNLVGDRLLP